MAEATLTVESFAGLFLEHYVRTHGIPLAIISARDVRFQSTFWKMFTEVLGTKLGFSTAFHPQTDCLAEKANDIVQMF
jgi:hypothetical protein